MTKAKKIFGLMYLVVFSAFFIFNCSNDQIKMDDDNLTVASCEGCHTNYAHLQEVFSPDTAAPAGGCGGEAPHYEPYDRVFMGGEGYDEYKESGHYAIGCTGCHNGTDDTDDKTVAHSGDFLAHPSMEYQDKCGTCHGTIAENFTTSLHHGTGQKRKVTIRSGLSGPEEFHKLDHAKVEGYNSNCATCHGTCGNCHVVRPPIGGGGLSNGHDFSGSPDMISVCVTCHTSRGGHAYLGVAPGTKPDVHLTKMDFECTDCHSGAELHGTGEPVNHRYAYSELPKCENCHSNLAESNTYHSAHAGDFNCQVCHSQDYNNCGSCHIHGEGARIPSYLDFKIAKNPIPEDRPDYKFTLVRRTLAAPDNWEAYGVEDYSNFDAFPTYNYTTPHNIQLWTKRTEVAEGASCYASCHISNQGGTLINKDLYLFEDNLLEWELDATRPIVVDGELPAEWMN
jgi:thiosulfate/3-mercaptopyruvate sulfurtransferase